MDNNKIVKYKDIYKEDPIQWNVLDDYIKIRDNGGGLSWGELSS